MLWIVVVWLSFLVIVGRLLCVTSFFSAFSHSFILIFFFQCTIYYEHHNRIRVHPLIVDISIKLVFANACINPILYGLFNANFRKAYIYYVKMLCFYLMCRMTSRPDGKNLPWSLSINRRYQATMSTAASPNSTRFRSLNVPS